MATNKHPVSRKFFPGKRPAVRSYFEQHPEASTAECVTWIKAQYGVSVRSKRVSTIRKQLGHTITHPQPSPKPQPSPEQEQVMKTTSNEQTNHDEPVEKMPPPKPTGTRAETRLDYAKFYRVCECLKEEKARFLEERPSLPKTAEMLSVMAGFPVSPLSIRQIQEVTGIKWEVKGTSPKKGPHKKNAIRTLTTAVVRLYRKFGEEIPSALADLYEEVNGRRPTALPGNGTENHHGPE